MKKLLPLLTILLLSILTSCTPEEDDDPLTAEDLAGRWSCQEQSLSGNISYEVDISKSSNDQIRINNFYKLGSGFFITVNISGQDLIIPQQTQNNVIFKGQGTILNRNRINLSFSADDGGGVIDNGSASLSR
jgi:hypothetical protein